MVDRSTYMGDILDDEIEAAPTVQIRDCRFTEYSLMKASLHF